MDSKICGRKEMYLDQLAYDRVNNKRVHCLKYL